MLKHARCWSQQAVLLSSPESQHSLSEYSKLCRSSCCPEEGTEAPASMGRTLPLARKDDSPGQSSAQAVSG
jgi:hypothetical protein